MGREQEVAVREREGEGGGERKRERERSRLLAGMHVASRVLLLSRQVCIVDGEVVCVGDGEERERERERERVIQAFCAMRSNDHR